MVKIDSILAAVRELPAADRAELIRRLLEQAFVAETQSDEPGARGLASLTESTAAEDWSAWYPPSLKNGRGH